MKNEPKFEGKKLDLTYDILKSEMVEMAGDNIDPHDMAKYLVWSLVRAGISRGQIIQAVKQFNDEFPHFGMVEVEKPVSSAVGVNAGLDGPYFMFVGETVQ